MARARKRRTTTDHRRIAVKFVDPASGRSLSFTVYCADLDDVARAGERAFSFRWSTTKLSDGRHKRRP